MADEEVHVTTTEARGASRGSPVRLVLVASLLLVIVAFIVIFLMGGIAL